MSTHRAVVEVEVPVHIAYDQVTHVERLPAIVPSVSSVRELADGRHRWETSVLGHARTTDTEIVTDRPDELIAWRSVEDADRSGSIRFAAIDDDRTRVEVELQVRPRGARETAADRLGIIQHGLRAALRQLKQHLEARPTSPRLNARYDPVT